MGILRVAEVAWCGDFEGSGGGMVWGILRVAEVVWCGGF